MEYYSANKEFVVKVNASNADVSVSINNINLTNTSDENGIATFTLPLLDPGVYLITTNFNGTSVINTKYSKNNMRSIFSNQSNFSI